MCGTADSVSKASLYQVQQLGAGSVDKIAEHIGDSAIIPRRRPPEPVGVGAFEQVLIDKAQFQKIAVKVPMCGQHSTAFLAGGTKQRWP